MKVIESAQVGFKEENGSTAVITPTEAIRIAKEVKEYLAHNYQVTTGIEEVVVTEMTIILKSDGSVSRVECQTNSEKSHWHREYPKDYPILVSV